MVTLAFTFKGYVKLSNMIHNLIVYFINLISNVRHYSFGILHLIDILDIYFIPTCCKHDKNVRILKKVPDEGAIPGERSETDVSERWAKC